MKLLNKKSYILILLVVFFGFSYLTVNAQTVSELKSKIEDRNKDIQKLEEEIAAYKKDLAGLDQKADTLQSSLNKLDLTRKKLIADIDVTISKIDSTNLTIEKLSLDIGDKEEKISKGQSAISQGLREMREMDSKSVTEILLSQKSLADTWKEIDAIRNVQSNIANQIEDLKTTKEDLEKDKNEAEEAKQKILFLQSELKDQKKINDQNSAEKNKLLKQTKNQEANYKKILQSKIALKEAFEKELSNFESQLKFILDPSTLPKSGSAVFAWPLDNILITQFFGATVAAKRLYVSGSHNGVDFAASTGTPIRAMASGTILGTGDTDLTCPGSSYGRWVLIKHNNGLASIYGHMSLIKAISGSTVSQGDIIGYSGNTGYTTGPHLHVGVYAANAVQISKLPSKSCGGKTYTMPVAATNAYLDPMVYLPSYNR